MRERSYTRAIPFLIFAMLPILYGWLYAPYGFSTTDPGFVQALSFRIDEGEIPYWNFIYVRPPLTPILHWLEMKILPDSAEILLARFNFYLFMWLTALFSVLSLKEWIQRSGISIWWIATIGFILSVHNYPPMPWHTVDGLLFASLGVFLLSRQGRLPILLAGMAALCLSALTKQSFYLMPLAGIAVIAWRHGRRPAMITGGITLAATLGLTLTWYLIWPEGFSVMIEQINGATGIGDLWEAVGPPYLKGLIWPIGLGLAAGIYFLLRLDRQGLSLFVFTLLSFFALVFALHIYQALHTQENVNPIKNWGQGFWWISAGVIFLYGPLKRLQDKPVAIMWAWLILAWCASVSWGYLTPLQGAAGLASISLPAFWTGLRKNARQLLPLGFALCAFFTYFVLYRYPYREVPVCEMNYHLGDLFPKAGGIYTGKENYEKHAELRALYREYGEPLTVLPAMPAANYLLDSPPPVQTDWSHNAEVRYEKNSHMLINKLNWTAPVVLIEKDKYGEIGESGRYGSMFADYVLKNWRRTDETDHFEVYRKP